MNPWNMEMFGLSSDKTCPSGILYSMPSVIYNCTCTSTRYIFEYINKLWEGTTEDDKDSFDKITMLFSRTTSKTRALGFW